MRPALSRQPLKEFLDRLVRDGVVTSAVGLVGTADEILREDSAGQAREGVPTHSSTRFDFASITKPFMATLALVLDAEGMLPLATAIGEVWPQAHPKLARKKLSDLLRHRSGLAPWRPLYHLCRSREEVLDLLLGGELLGTRADTYSDLDFILWGMTAVKATGQSLPSLIRSRVLDPLGLSSVEPTPGDQPDVAESRMNTTKETQLAARAGIAIETLPPPPVGFPQDGNCRFLTGLEGGIGRLTGNAGLFGRARDLWILGAEWLEPRKLLQPEGVAAALRGGRSFALGWWRRTLKGGGGRALSPSSFGHTGFAGGNLWIDPERRRVLVLLGHRIDPLADIHRWRRKFHSLNVR
ncbi:MAG TPA: serine hydrolase [Thermoanaerobaculia bacterium]